MNEAIREALRLIPNEPAVKDKQMIFLIIFCTPSPHVTRTSRAPRTRLDLTGKLKKNYDCPAC